MKHLFDANTVAARFAACLDTAARDQRLLEARNWYAEAETYATELVALRPSSWTIEIAASVISAYSPRTRWAHNKYKAWQHARYERPAGIGAHYLTALKAEMHGFDALRGLKTNAFARAIAGDKDAVVIDTWMMKAAGLSKDAPTRLQYRIMADLIRAVAPRYNLYPRDAQAAIWIVQRGSAV